jgi:hypothetical protein
MKTTALMLAMLLLQGCILEVAELGEVTELGALRGIGAEALLDEGSLFAGGASETLAVRLAAVTDARLALLNTDQSVIRVMGSVNGKPVIKAILQTESGEVLVRDQFGMVRVSARRRGARLYLYDKSGWQTLLSG